MDSVFKKSIDSLTGTSKELFDVLKYILDDDDLALGYLGNFEHILLKAKIKAKIEVLQHFKSGIESGVSDQLIKKYVIQLIELLSFDLKQLEL